MKIEPELGAPMLLKLSSVQHVYQEVEDTDENGELILDENGEPLLRKMQATKEFKDKLNGLVFGILARCINNALEDNRNTLWPEDVPNIEEV